MKILHLTQFLGVGGLEKVIYLLIQEQRAAGHHVELMVYDYEQSWVDHFRERGITIRTDYRKREGYDKKLLIYLDKMVRDFDIIHTHDINPCLYIGPLKCISKFLARPMPKWIHTAHGMDHVHKRPITKYYEKVCGLFTDCIVGVSPALSDFYRHHLFIHREKVLNIDNGTHIRELPLNFDKSFYKDKLEKQFNLPRGKSIWVCVARIVPLKDQRLLLEAARQNPNINLLLVGPSGDDAYWAQLAQEKPDNVSMLGGQSDIESILLGSDFFVSASTHEGIPVSVLEAGAAKLPCLLSNISGHLTLQKNYAAPVAMFFETSNLSSLKNKMDELMQDTVIQKAIALNLNLKVKRDYSATKMYQEYMTAYKEKVHYAKAQ